MPSTKPAESSADRQLHDLPCGADDAIMFVVGCPTVFLDFAPFDRGHYRLMSLLDDVPIMTIAYYNTPLSAKPIPRQMPRLLGVAVRSAFSRS